MFRKILRFFKEQLFPIVLVLLVVFIAWKNYVPETWLSGWDTLHPEFNLSLYLKRAFYGVWQEHQGVGAVASQSHAAELARLLIVYLLTLVTSLSSVRYLFFFITLLSGVLGSYYFILRSLNNKEFVSGIASFLGACFYFFSLSTVQQYYVPLEMFAVHFALLPWLFLFAVKYLKSGKRGILIIFALVTIFSSSMAHTSTLFAVYLASLILFLLTWLLINRNKKTFKRVLVLSFMTILLNAYWLLPNGYFLLNNAADMRQSTINRVFTDEAYLQSNSYGNINDLALSKNFLFNWREFDYSDNTFVDLMDEWKDHLNSPYVKMIGYFLFSASIVGLILSFITRNKVGIALSPVLLLSVFFIINANSPFTEIFEYLRNKHWFFGEGFRFPYTKFSIIFTFTLSFYFAYFFNQVFMLVKKILKRGRVLAYALVIILSVFVFGAQVYFIKPVFSGHLISPSMKVNIPNEYFEMFSWFDNKSPHQRIAKLPLNTFWGWNFYSWGYQGAGFTWFGLPQPSLDREFDRWSPHNESFYNQAAFSLYEGDLDAFEKTLEKYHVRYLLLDESILNAGGSNKLLYIDKTKRLLKESKHIKEAVEFNFLTVYETDWDYGDSFINAPDSYTRLNVDMTYSQVDYLYNNIGNYVYKNDVVSYPFTNYDKRADVEAKRDNGNIVLENKNIGSKVILPIEEEIKEDFNQNRGFPYGYNCDLDKAGEISKQVLFDGIRYKAENGGVSCDFFYYDQLKYNQGYILHLEGKNIKGRSLKVYLQNTDTKRMDLEELLPKGEFDEYFVVLPKNVDGKGYSLNLETRSYGKVASESVINLIEFIPVSIDYLLELKTSGNTPHKVQNSLKVLNVIKIGTYKYIVKTEGEGLLVLSQGFDDGWIALDGRNILKHLKVNSWSNGWILDNDITQVTIVFWPQYLQFIGFGLLILGFLVLVFPIPKKKLTKARGKR